MDGWADIWDRLRADADVLDQQALAADTHEEMLSVRRFAADIRAALKRVEHVEGAMRADDKRLEDAAVKVWGEHRWGCDTPDQMADLILSLRQRVEEMERGRVAPDDLGVMRDASGLSERCHELVRRLLKQSQRAEAAEAKLARCVEALGEIRGRSLAAKTHEVGPLEAKGRLTRILELACAALAAAKGE